MVLEHHEHIEAAFAAATRVGSTCAFCRGAFPSRQTRRRERPEVNGSRSRCRRRQPCRMAAEQRRARPRLTKQTTAGTFVTLHGVNL